MGNRITYIILGFSLTLILTPLLSWLLTSGVTDFEGASGFAWLYSLPISFILLLLLWFLDHKFNSKRFNNYFKTRSYIFLSLIIITILGFYIQHLKEEKQKKTFKRTRIECVTQYQESYNGYVIDTVYSSLKIRKMDSSYTEFKYKYLKTENFKTTFFRGQKISKKANASTFQVILKNGKTESFTIPCYE